MTALTCTDTAPSGSHARSTWEYAGQVRSGHNGSRRAALASTHTGIPDDHGVHHEPPLHHASQTPTPLSAEAFGDDLMTDARFPDRWLSRRSFVALPEPAFKLYVLSMMWAVSNRTDGAISASDLDYVPCPSGADLCAVLVDAEMWAADTGGWIIRDFPTTQTSAAQLAASEAYAARERERKAVDRARKKVAKPTSPQERRTDDREMSQGQDRDSARTGELPPPDTNGLGQCRTCDHREPLGPDGRCRSCAEWDVQEETR